MTTNQYQYQVTMRFKHPAWDEQEGIIYLIQAPSKTEACARARRQADDDGHCGIRFFTATTSE